MAQRMSRRLFIWRRLPRTRDKPMAKCWDSLENRPVQRLLRPDAAGFVYIDRDAFHAAFCADLSEEEATIMAITQRPVARRNIWGKLRPRRMERFSYLLSDFGERPDFEAGDGRIFGEPHEGNHSATQSQPCRFQVASAGSGGIHS